MADAPTGLRLSMPPDMPTRILIRGVNWVGDAVIAIPAMREIRTLFPKAHIALLVRPWVRDVYAGAEFIDEILEYDKERIHRGPAGFGRLAFDLKRRCFDMAILLQNAFEAALLGWCARIPRRVGYARDGRAPLLTTPCRIDPAVRPIHQAYYYLGILSAAGWIKRPWEDPSYIPRIQVGVRAEHRSAARAILRAAGVQERETVVGINPGAFYGPAKRWFPERFAEVADALIQQHAVRIVIFGGPSDLRTAGEVAASMKRSPIILAGKTTLGQLMGLIKECSLILTNDSGPMHLAAALDVPQVAIFGSTSEVATGPLSSNAAVVKHQVDCNPCFLKECPRDFRCMKGVSTEMVLAAATNKLAIAGDSRGATQSPT